MKHGYNESANFNENPAVQIDANEPSKLAEILSVIGMAHEIT